MDILTAIFAHICGQGHCFIAGGEALPVCQRCLGLYVGAGITAAWLAASGIGRRGLPSWGVFLAQEGAILAAMLGGLHVWGEAPAAKVLCGLWTGHVATAWLVGGTGHLWRLSRPDAPPQRPWRLRDKLQAFAALGLLAALASAVPRAMAVGWWAWSAAALAGAMALAAAVAAAAVALAAYGLRRLRPRPESPDLRNAQAEGSPWPGRERGV